MQSAHREARLAQESAPQGTERERLVALLRGFPPEMQGRVAHELLLDRTPEARTQTRCFLALLYSTLALEAGANEAAFEELSATELTSWKKGVGKYKKPKGRSEPPWRWCCLLAHLEGASPSYDPLTEAAHELFLARNALVHYDLGENAAIEERLLPPGLDALPLIWPPGYPLVAETPATLERLITPSYAAMAYHTARAVMDRANPRLQTPFRLPPPH